MTKLKRLLVTATISLLAALIILSLILAFNTFNHGSRQIEVIPVAPFAVDEQAVAERLVTALRFKTISNFEQPRQNSEEFEKMHRHLEMSFPRTHALLTRETIGGASLLYRWQGSDTGALPIMLMAHQDVVPVAPGTEKNWQQPPFEGIIKDGYVWGRGSWDDKGNLFSIMEAVESLLESGFQPRRTIYLAFGHDEEVSGLRGAKAIAALLQSRHIRLDYILDEGLLITEGILKGLEAPAALIGVAEKGYTTIQLDLTATSGHSSMPPQQSAIGMMSKALIRLEDQQFPAQIRGVALDMFETLAPEMSGFNRVALSNLWLFKPLLQIELAKGPGTNAMLRTTTALTMVHAGNKDNVLPGIIQATINFRTLPGDSQASVVKHVKDTVANNAINITTAAANSEPSRISPISGKPYGTIARTVREIFPGTVVAPGLMLGASDSRHFEAISDHIFKFSPVRAGPDDLPRFHGTDERIAIKNYVEMIRFYRQLLINSASL